MDHYLADAEVIFCSRLLAAKLARDATVVVELSISTNYSFVPLPGHTGFGGRVGGPQLEVIETKESRFAAVKKLLSRGSSTYIKGLDKRPTIAAQQIMDASQLKTNEGQVSATSMIPEYYRQPRFACGQLFASNVVTCLAVNMYYNQTLEELVRAMISATIKLIPVKDTWVGKSYREYLDYLLFEMSLLPVAILRLADRDSASTGSDGRDSLGSEVPDMAGMTRATPPYYIYTAPPAQETNMFEGD